MSEGRERYERVLARFRRFGVSEQAFETALGAGHFACFMGTRAAGQSLLEEALWIGEQLGDKSRVARALFYLGGNEVERGNFAVGHAHYEKALDLHQESGDRQRSAWTLAALGRVTHYEGDLARSRAYLEAALALCLDLGPGGAHVTAYTLMQLGHVARLSGDFTLARSRYQESLHRYLEGRDRVWTVTCLEGIACLAASQGRAVCATRLFGACDAMRATLRKPPTLLDRALWESPLHAACSSLGEAVFAAAWNEGQAMSLEQAVAYAATQNEGCDPQA
jgi:tetratricopeptide (TPR) repeat protein